MALTSHFSPCHCVAVGEGGDFPSMEGTFSAQGEGCGVRLRGKVEAEVQEQ